MSRTQAVALDGAGVDGLLDDRRRHADRAVQQPSRRLREDVNRLVGPQRPEGVDDLDLPAGVPEPVSGDAERDRHRQPATAGSVGDSGTGAGGTGKAGTGNGAERDLDDLLERRDRPERHVASRFRRQFVEVVLVLRRQDHGLDALPPRRERLFLDAADGQDEAAQRDLAGHRDVGRDRRSAGPPRGWRVAIVTPGRRAVLGDGAGRHVQVQVVRLERVGGDAERRRRASARGSAPRAPTPA